MADLSQHHAAGVRSFAFAEARDAAFAAASRELRFCLDAEGRLTHVEGPWQSLLGREPIALLGAHWRVAVSPLDHAAMRVAIEHVLSAREPVELDLRMDADTDADCVVHWSLLAGAGADLITAVGYEQDHALAAAQAESARLRQQVRELESKVDVLSEHSRSMEGFAATAAHQLSEPLIVAESGTIMVAEDLGDALDPELRARLDAIGRGAARARQMVDALLLDARSGSGLALKAVDTAQIAAQVLEDLAPQMHERSAVAEVGELPVVHAEPRLLSDRLPQPDQQRDQVRPARRRADPDRGHARRRCLAARRRQRRYAAASIRRPRASSSRGGACRASAACPAPASAWRSASG